MSNKQSSVEWFAQESWKLRVELEDDEISIGEYVNKHYQLKEQAKAMHKEEIEKAWWAGCNESLSNHIIHPSEDCNGYYNETFKIK